MLALWLLLQASPPPVTFTASVGTVTTGGLYTAPANPSGPATITVRAGGQTVTVPVTFVAPAVVAGLPFGPFGLWSSSTTVAWGPQPFTASQNYSDPATIVTQIQAARAMRQRLVLAMTGGSKTQFQTNGAFDLAKWKARLDRFNTAAIRAAVAAGVADGTLVGNSLMDEPEHADWGGGLSKPVVNQMAAYAHGIFPTLPVGVNHGPAGYYQWRPTERYTAVDYVLNQYNWWVSKGDVAAWRTKVLAQAALDGVTPAFSLNLLNGGVQDKDGTWDCTGTGGKGTRDGNCRMTAAQVQAWGTALGPSGCLLLSWEYEPGFMQRTENHAAFTAVAATLAAVPRRSCHRP